MTSKIPIKDMIVILPEIFQTKYKSNLDAPSSSKRRGAGGAEEQGEQREQRE